MIGIGLIWVVPLNQLDQAVIVSGAVDKLNQRKIKFRKLIPGFTAMPKFDFDDGDSVLLGINPIGIRLAPVSFVGILVPVEGDPGFMLIRPPTQERRKVLMDQGFVFDPRPLHPGPFLRSYEAWLFLLQLSR